jgi:hypothetical protein
LIERNKLRKRRPRPHSKKPPAFKQLNGHNSGPPKSRGQIVRILEKYTNLAQDANSNGDKIVAENFYQFAEHYQRLLNENNSFQKSDSKNISVNDEKESNEVNQIKPSRTQRAIDAKEQRHKGNGLSSEESSTKENFTQDGLEALKPFQTSVNTEKNSQSS